MTSLKLLGLAAIVASTLATPAFAQTTVDNSGRCTGLFQDPNCQNLAPGNPTTDRAYRRRHMARGQVNSNDETRSGFWPVDTAGAVAGAAVGTAAAVASAPFRGWDNSYAYDASGGYAGGRSEMGWYGNWDTYAARNGIVCRPGTWYKGADGLQHICQ
ncbi:hypothetical protein ABIF65_004283 [Bradyrhizobium japonicum]|jgi:hypothetical protein|uniref:hypothetical protein n=1 Tax=Bradyrhizobium TaxID=374 RepID=UPI000401ADD3|nr:MULTISPECIES: hypothetical protein [Bradyrhizobium]MBR0883067.1 hypothetical protein [Bradyrhizobium liaoningense]MBR0946853.1 hypothetical protein [Bradyrhizobium liaoningense]MBR0999978.1 hypothetical protein [Bradyrhizobium liaoningense]MBR1069315.1 hypothetical protein [Bradyrhizobium liaoningense]MCP1742595.1 hypothetical protein [Bradyrhizobium japonicum]